jgi:3-hydroxybutyrate dehydrogenase
MDVTSEQQVEDGTAKVIQVFGALDVLISNAGIQIVAPVVDVEFAKWKRLLAIHLDGAFLTTRAALRQMYKQNSGSIIYMGSVHSKENLGSQGTLCHGQARPHRSCQGRG